MQTWTVTSGRFFASWKADSFTPLTGAVHRVIYRAGGARRFPALLIGLHRTDLAGRWGSEEFAVLLLDTHLDEARSIMERLRAAVALDEQMVEQGWPVTFSCGLTPIRTITEFDDAAKNGGRNRVNAAD